MIARLRKRFSISICEVDHQNLWQRSSLGFSAVCSNNRDVDLILQSIHITLEHYEDDCNVTDLTYDLITS